jgi:hypothetical protein
MKKYIYIVAAITVMAFSTGVFAQQGGASGSDAKSDSVAVMRQAQASSGRALNKQAAVNRPTKKTNWSKIKTLFE